MEVKGIVKVVTPTVELSDKFKKRDLIIEYAEDPKYVEMLKFEAHNANCDKLDELREGDDVTVHFNLRGRAWTNKEGVTSYFNTLAAWQVKINQTAANVPAKMAPVDINVPAGGVDDDLPF